MEETKRYEVKIENEGVNLLQFPCFLSCTEKELLEVVRVVNLVAPLTKKVTVDIISCEQEGDPSALVVEVK